MEWKDQAIVLTARRHGEHAAVVSLLTRAHGRHAGLVRGGWGKRGRAAIEPGNRAFAVWRARLAEHLGNLTLEVEHSTGAALLEDADRLAAMASALAVSEAVLPEREPHAQVYEGLEALLDVLEGGSEDWPSAYVKWELGLLGELGFGLDLSHCAATGETENLVYVSPKSARAVSKDAGTPYADKMLALPEFLKIPGAAAETREDVLNGLKLTGFFLNAHVLGAHSKHLPDARTRMVERLQG